MHDLTRRMNWNAAKWKKKNQRAFHVCIKCVFSRFSLLLEGVPYLLQLGYNKPHYILHISQSSDINMKPKWKNEACKQKLQKWDWVCIYLRLWLTLFVSVIHSDYGLCNIRIDFLFLLHSCKYTHLRIVHPQAFCFVFPAVKQNKDVSEVENFMVWM